MTRPRVRFRQNTTAGTGMTGRWVRVTVETVSPLTVLLPGQTTAVGAQAVQGQTYTVDAAGWAWFQEPAVGQVFMNA